MTITTFSRRGFLKGVGAGGLLLGIGAGGAIRAIAAETASGVTINQWLHIGADGTVTVYSNAQEMGQGAMSGVAQVLADEMRLPWELVRVVQAPMDPVYGLGDTTRLTGGSRSIREQWGNLRKAGAAAREMLVQAGAMELGVGPEAVEAADGRVVVRGGKRGVSYGKIAARAATLPVPESPRLLSRADWTLIGRAVPRKDIPEKVDGSALYTTDLKLPGLLTATVLQCPAFGGRLVSVDPAPALAVRGVRAVVPIRGVAFTVTEPWGRWEFKLPDAVAVVAEGWWPAKKGLAALSPVWDEAGNTLDTTAIETRVAGDLIREGEERIWQQDAAEMRSANSDGKARAVRSFTAEYSAPYLAHALMEPLSAVAHVHGGDVEVWSGSQWPTGIQRFMAGMLGVPEDRVTTHTLYSGGGFGRRYINDYVVQAVILSREVGAPVKVVWTREEELAQGRYRPATAARLTAHLDSDGMPTALDLAFSSNVDDQVALIRPPGFPDQPDYAPPYLIPGSRTTVVRQPDLPVPTGPWRAPGSNQNAFYVESFIDELAVEAKVDPLDYRRRLLAGNPRARRVLDAAAAAAGWGRTLAPGHGLGIAMWNCFGSVCAQVVEVAMWENRLSVRKVTCAIDCGTAVNPDSIRAQGEGSIIMGLSAALMEKVEMKAGAVTTTNFDSYPILTLAGTPEIEIIVLESPDVPVGGVGEPMLPPVAPALANAIHASCRTRIRALPVNRQGIDLA